MESNKKLKPASKVDFTQEKKLVEDLVERLKMRDVNCHICIEKNDERRVFWGGVSTDGLLRVVVNIERHIPGICDEAVAVLFSEFVNNN